MLPRLGLYAMVLNRKSSKGEDSDGKKYKDVGDMWDKELRGEDGRKGWYARATSYWEAMEANVNGVLGGYPETSGPDLRESKRFLELIKKAPNPPVFDSVLDCGAGIGRVTSGLLLNHFKQVDLVEPNKRLLDTAQKEITDVRVEQFINSSLQEFEPAADRYDVIWAQWVLLYLPDDDLHQFLVRCRKALKSGGIVCAKENVVLEGEWVVDKEDNSIARTDAQYKAIFERAGFTVEHQLRQTCWPSDLIPVKMYALRPSEDSRVNAGRPVLKRPASAMTE